VFLLVGYLRRI